MRWNDVVDQLVEAPIAPSFTRLGYDIRSRTDHWDPVDDDLSDRVVVVTGATSGLGRSAARTLAQLGATVVLVGRDPDRTESTRAELAAETGNAGVETAIADMGDLEAVAALADELAARHDRIDVLVHNAGALTKDRRESPQGLEMTVASQVMGPFLLTARMLPQLRRGGPGRVLTMSSGGMYAAPLTISGLQMSDGDYDGTEQYARAKRAQVTLNEMWAERVDPGEVVFHALHPGWADTPGVAESLPTFRRIVGPLLRTPEQGADTLVWLAATDRAPESSGGFWLDRRPRSIHRLPTTRRSDTPARRARLWDECRRVCGLDEADLPPLPV
jgi:NAD(P)-dependent dehydrogenase (short-subunit alcohol dehydrogenase family)